MQPFKRTSLKGVKKHCFKWYACFELISEQLVAINFNLIQNCLFKYDIIFTTRDSGKCLGKYMNFINTYKSILIYIKFYFYNTWSGQFYLKDIEILSVIVDTCIFKTNITNPYLHNIRCYHFLKGNGWY